MSGPTEVLVVGAGPTGLSLACDLARRGVAVRVVEKARELFPGSRGKGLQPRTQEVFDDLGVMTEVAAGGSRFPRMMTWEDGEQRGEWHLITPGPDAPDSFYSHVWMIPQWRTQAILHARLRELGGAVDFGTELVGLRQDEQVTAVLRGPDGARATVRVPYLVGADGGHSAVRRLAEVAMVGEEVDVRSSLVADVVVPELDRGHWHVWPKAPGGTMLLCPLPGTDDFQLSAQFQAEVPDTTADGVRRLVAHRSHLPASAVTGVRCVSHYQPRVALAEHYRVGGVFLAGDAAHIHPPGGGQGLNTGVQDAYNLGWKLGQVLRHGAAPELLDTYEQERLPVAADVLDLSTKLYRVGRVPQVGSVDQARERGRKTHQLGVNYRGGPLSVEARGEDAGGARAGDRATDGVCDLPGGGRGRLHDVLRGPHFTLLSAEGGPGRVPEGVRVHRVTSPTLRHAFGEGLFLVRPDGYVGVATHDHDDVLAYLAGVGVS